MYLDRDILLYDFLNQSFMLASDLPVSLIDDPDLYHTF